MNWEDRDDAAQLNAAVRDREAFACFYRQHAVAVYRWFAYRVRREGTLANELTAETFAEALRSLPNFKGSCPGSGTAWLFGIARNLAREYYRTNRIRNAARRQLSLPHEAELDAAFDDVGDRIDSARLRSELDAALARLPPAQRKAITLRIVEELDYASIAEVTSTSEQNVRLRVSRGLRTLRTQLTPAITEEEQ